MDSVISHLGEPVEVVSLRQTLLGSRTNSTTHLPSTEPITHSSNIGSNKRPLESDHTTTTATATATSDSDPVQVLLEGNDEGDQTESYPPVGLDRRVSGSGCGLAVSSSHSILTPSEEKASDDSRRRVLVIYCGGTVGMVRDEATGAYIPSGASLAKRLGALDEWGNPHLPRVFVAHLEPALDSSDMWAPHWQHLAKALGTHYDSYDGFVVLHGTDTMAYTASACSFCLENLAKPVVFTGSQIPLLHLRSDARANLIDSLLIAAHSRVPEVLLVFDRHILRANRATKINSWGLTAFRSCNHARLGLGGIKLVINPRRIRPLPAPDAHFVCRPNFHPDVALLALYPGVHLHLRGLLGLPDESVAETPVQPRFKGVVLEAFGSGNASSDPRLLKTLADACAAGVVIVVTSACLEGSVVLETYDTGMGLKRVGCVSAYDMTHEAAFTKLSYLLGQGHTPDVVRDMMTQDLAGEITLARHPAENTFRHHEIVF